jgi:putative transposase
MRYKLIDTNKAAMPVERMCRMMAVSVSGYYAWKVRKPSLHQCCDVVLAANIRARFATSNQTYGAPRMHAELCEEGLSVGRHRVARLMRENGLKAHQKRRFKKTTDSCHDCPIAFNILDQNFACDGPDQKWGADIGYIWTAEGWLYLAIVLDLYSRRIVGWATSDRLKKDLALKALSQAILIRRPPDSFTTQIPAFARTAVNIAQMTTAGFCKLTD